MLTELQILQQLKQKYDKHLVSALIGSGFTKNIYAKSPSWWELLKDLVAYAYDAELKETYKDYSHKILFPHCYGKRLDTMIDAIVQRDGYLDVVSNFIKKKGCREAIDLYIEEKNPFFYIDGGKIKVKRDDVTVIDGSKYETHKSLLECDWQHIYTTNFDNALEITSEICNLGYSAITNDYQLSRERLNKAIIKIHGNLVDRDCSLDFDKRFEFDGDKTRRYIISREDFDTYFQRHQAFSYLLRIALLSGDYCLMGFSGDDPNFLGWLEWVKDILDKEPQESINSHGENSTYEQIKVFLILKDNDDIPDDRKLFYRNHHIGVIHLTNDGVKRELEITSPNPSNGQLFQSLFSYLRKGNEGVSLLTTGNVPYYSLWRNVYDKVSDSTCPSLADDIAIIKGYRSDNRFIKSYAYQERIFDKFVQKSTLSDEQKDIFILALKDLRIPPYQYKAKVFEQTRTTENWSYIQNREETFNGTFVPIDEYSDSDAYENILRLLYHLDFDNAKLALSAWNPNGSWVTVKASISYIFNRKESLAALDEYIKNTNNPTEQYIASTLYNCIDSRFVASRTLDKYKGLDGIAEMLHFYIQQIDKRKEEVLSYGQQQDTQSMEDAIIYPQKYACRALHFIADSGLNTCYGISNVINIQDWYKIFSYTYSFYPWPCLYYSAQYNNQKALKRIGQDYAYDESLSEVLPQIATIVLDRLANHSIPAFLRFGLFQITGEFFVAIPETEWYPDFILFLQKCFVPDGDKYIDYRDSLRFVSFGLNSILDPLHIAECLTILLDYFFVKSSDAVALICNNLRLNKLTSLDEQVSKHIQPVASSENFNDSIYLFNYLDEQKLLPIEIKTTYLENVFAEPANLEAMGMRSLLNLCILAKDNDSYRNSLIEEILSRDFWGRTKGSMVGGEEYFFRFTLLPSEYTFTTEQSSSINSKLQTTFSEIMKLRSSDLEMFRFSYQDSLGEMNRYISKHRDSFNSDFIRNFEREFNASTGYSNFEDALYCETSEKIDSALTEIFNNFDNLTFDSIESLYSIAVQRLLIKQNTSNTYLLYFVARVLEKHTKNILRDSTHINNLLRLLLIYSQDDLRIYNFLVVEAMGCFIKIATILSENGYQDDEYVKWWLDDAHIKRFNYWDMFN